MTKAGVRRQVVAILSLSAATAAVPAIARIDIPPDALQPPQAVAAIDRHRGNLGVIGVFGMTVAAVGQERGSVFLNSSSDYRSADDLTFRLKPAVAHRLVAQLRLASRQQLIGRHLAVRGIGKAVPIMAIERGHPPRFVRYQHMVTVDQIQQISAD